MTYKEKLLDPRWQKKRLEILERDNWACQWCGDAETTLHVHHLYYSGSFPWETEDDGLQTLCSECHDVNHLNTTDLEKILINSVRAGHRGDTEFIKMVNRVITRAIKERENG
jgi:5-methylcytosine-specific restriction endonuclease McrA